MEDHAESIGARDHGVLARLIHRSVEIKASVVAADERESGCRAILNAGHTIAHALEQVSGFELAHGEAVAIGLATECGLAEELGIAPEGLRERVTQLLTRLGLPTRLERPVEPGAVLEAMRTDKKNRNGRLHFALPADLGRMSREGGWTTSVSAGAIRQALTPLGQGSNP
jgi:3-dehydroquinate synthetase